MVLIRTKVGMMTVQVVTNGFGIEDNIVRKSWKIIVALGIVSALTSSHSYDQNNNHRK